MYLKLPFSGGAIDLDQATGSYTLTDIPVDVKSSGNAGMVNGRLVALYAHENALYVRIDQQRWKIDEVSINYAHNVHDKKTTFVLSSNQSQVELVYPAWWAEIPDFRPVEPEMDADEDYLGYIYAVFSDKNLQKHLVDTWM